MDANDDTVRSIADLLRRSSSIDPVLIDPDGLDDGDEAARQKKIIRSDSIKTTRSRITTDLMRDDEEGLELEPSIITESTLPTGDLSQKLPKCLRREFVLKLFVFLLFVCIVVSLAVIFHFYNRHKYLDMLGQRIILDEQTRTLDVLNIHREEVLRGFLGLNLSPGSLPYDCTAKQNASTEVCLRWRNAAELHISYYAENTTNCYDISWQTLDQFLLQTPKDCFELDWGYLYGGGFLPHAWPLNNVSVPMAPFTSSSVYSSTGWGPVIERYWLFSSGVALHVDPDVPLHVSINHQDSDNKSDHFICLAASYASSAFQQPLFAKPNLKYTMCVGPTVHHAHQVMLENSVMRPHSAPASELFEGTVWSTWAHFKNSLSQSSLEDFAKDISDHSYGYNTLLIIDSGWQEKYGDLNFHSVLFPTPLSMVQSIRSHGFEVGLWVNSLCNIDSAAFQETVLRAITVTDSGGMAPGLVQWHLGPLTRLVSFMGTASVIDMSLEGADWFQLQLSALQSKFSISSFNFWGGEASSLPYRPKFKEGFADPSEYSTAYAHLASGFNNQGYGSIVSTAYRAQHLVQLLRLTDTESTWDDVQGLRSIIPSVLTLGLLGYPFVLPDSIGGSGIPMAPSEELYMRWMQLSAFLPIMHFSRPPHNYSQQVIQLAHHLVELHTKLVAPRVIALAQEAVVTMHPIIRPLWWIDPTDHVALTVSSQFLIGDDLLVAPILEEGALSRDIYLPSGTWQDSILRSTTEGPKWLRNYQVELTQIPYFLRI